MNTKIITLTPEFEKAVMDLGFDEFTEIQEKCIPLIQEGKDIVGLSHTGSGKTAAFGFPTLEKVTPGKGIQLLVIVPTRELCNQIGREFKKFTKYRKTYIVEVYGGVSISPQIEHMRHADVVVGTPGRLLDHLSRGTFDTRNIRILVLDEADKMFDMGFIDDIQLIVSRLPKCQKLLFGATMPKEIMKLVDKYMNNPEKVKMPTYVDKSKLMQHYYDVRREDKFSLLVHTVKQADGLVIVFCGSRRMVDVVNRNLSDHGIKAMALHGGMEQGRRNSVMEAFHQGRIDALIATDVAARGLDIKNVNLIINYDLPKTSVEYVHRIGRTARVGREGKVISLLTREDHGNFKAVLQDRSLLVHKLDTPHFERLRFIMMAQRNHEQQRRFSGPQRRFPGQRGGHRGRFHRRH